MLFKILFHVIYHHRRKWFSPNLVKDGDDLLEEVLTYEPPIPEYLTDEDILAALEKIPTDFRECFSWLMFRNSPTRKWLKP